MSKLRTYSTVVLKTASVPPELEPVFASAEEAVSRFFSDRRDDPEHGTIEIFGERYILVRAASLSLEFFTLVEQLFGAGRETEADEFARNLLFDLAHALGKSDARTFHAKMGLIDPIARLAAGPPHFSYSGWASVHIYPESRPVADDDFLLVYDHPYSFESSAWLKAGRSSEFPVCIMNAGYSSGWTSESFGVPLVAYEVRCRSRGDDACRFLMAPTAAIERRVSDYFATQPEARRACEIPEFFARKRAEDELRRIYERLKELDEVKTRLFANVSHELRTPLTIILGITDPLRELSSGDEHRRGVETVARNARRLLGHVNDLLEVAKLEAGRMRLAYVETELAALVRLVASYFEVVAADRGVRYVVDAPPRLMAQLDAEKVQRVLTNLLANAFKFTPVGGTVRCALSADADCATIAVADSGPGVPPEARERVFDRFVSVEPGPGRSGGTGLGLSIARELTLLHGGEIAVEMAPEGGACFVVELPLRAPAGMIVRGTAGPVDFEGIVRSKVEALGPAPAPAAPAQPVGAPLVLVVEDNVEMSNFLVERLAGEFRAVAAFDGEEGLTQARALRPDLVITDVMMPRMAGDQLVERLRSDPDLAGIPILLLSAKADDELRLRLLRMGAQDYLTKPVASEELLVRARNLIATKRTRDILQAELATTRGDVVQLAQELARNRRELQDSLETTRVACEHAERASYTKSTLLRMVSHELRTPLQNLLLNLECVREERESLAPAQQTRVDRIDRAAERLRDLTESVLEFVRQESGRLEVQREDVALRGLVEAVVEALAPQAARKRLDLRVDGDASAPPVWTDPRLLRLVLRNLVGNAIKYTERGGVHVRVAGDSQEDRIEIADTGPGIPTDKHAVIFEPFTRLESLAQHHTPGLGIGLSLVGTIMEALGGRVSLTSEVGRGSTFVVHLPFVRP